MNAIHRLCSDGAFIAGDTETGVTSYSYATSPNAERAKRYPAKVAAEILAARNAERQMRIDAGIEGRDIHGTRVRRDYDARNWAELGFAMEHVGS